MPNYVGSGIGGAIQPGVDPWNPYKAEQIRLDLVDHEDGLADHEVRIFAVEGSGVDGPASATDNMLARFDGTTGKLIQTSVITVSDDGTVALPDGIRQTFNPNSTNAGMNVGSQAGDPSSLSNGDVWYNSTTNELKSRVNGVTSALRQRIVVTLTDAQVKTLPGTPVIVIAAPGSNRYINIEYAILQAKFSAGAYTNVNATYASLALAIGSGGLASGAGPLQGVTNDSSTTPVMTALATFLGAANRQVKLLPYAEAVPVAAAVGYFVPTFDGAYNMDLFTNLNNIAAYISADNNGSGSFTGGNAANTVRVVVYYTIEDVP